MGKVRISKKKKKSIDRISNLPSGVIDDILKRLSLHDAVRTSILSREWRYNWVTIPYLQLNRRGKFYLKPHKFESFVDSILLQHKGTISRFAVELPENVSHNDIDRLLHFLSNHPVECLTFGFPGVPHYLLHKYVFSFEHLTKLELEYVAIVLPHEFKGFSQLLKLSLCFVVIEPEELRTIISKCPKLETLVIYFADDEADWYLDVEAPNLKCFEFSCSFQSIRLVCPGLEELSMCSFESYVDSATESSMIKFFDQLRSVKKVVFACGVMEIHDDLDYDNADEERVIQYLKAKQNYNNVCLSRLEYVGIYDMWGMKCEMELLKVILLWATSLEKLNIVPKRRCKEKCHLCFWTRYQSLVDHHLNQLYRYAIKLFPTSMCVRDVELLVRS